MPEGTNRLPAWTLRRSRIFGVAAGGVDLQARGMLRTNATQTWLGASCKTMKPTPPRSMVTSNIQSSCFERLSRVTLESWEVSEKNVLVFIYFYVFNDFFMNLIYELQKMFFWIYDCFMIFYDYFMIFYASFYDFLWKFYDVLWFFYDFFMFFSAHVALIKS
jgi:hypothetical protein